MPNALSETIKLSFLPNVPNVRPIYAQQSPSLDIGAETFHKHFGIRISNSSAHSLMARSWECIPQQCQPQTDCRSEWNMHTDVLPQNSLAYFSITIVEFTNTLARNVDDFVHVYRNTLSTFRIRVRWSTIWKVVCGYLVEGKNNLAIRKYSIIMYEFCCCCGKYTLNAIRKSIRCIEWSYSFMYWNYLFRKYLVMSYKSNFTIFEVECVIIPTFRRIFLSFHTCRPILIRHDIEQCLQSRTCEAFAYRDKKSFRFEWPEAFRCCTLQHNIDASRCDFELSYYHICTIFSSEHASRTWVMLCIRLSPSRIMSAPSSS